MDQRGYGFVFACAAGSTVEVHDNVVQQPNGGFIARSSNSALGVDLHDNTYYSSAPNPPDVWSRGWFDITSSVSSTAWVTATAETGMITEQVAYVDPDRTVGTYMTTLGGPATDEAFLAEAVQQSKYNWRPQYTSAAVNAYVREGFAPVP